MTSRLKRKLNDLGVDSTSAKANESFCRIGTPLPPLEKSKDTGEFVPLWKQDVRDEKGRRRLHGAFTGGFSAGYFNTVGSKEGWTPSTFVSSRADRAKQKAARPEDFMDEEDLAELQDSRKLVDEHDEMDFGGTEAELRRRAGVGTEEEQEDSISAALQASLAPAPKDSVGAKILKKMGWRLGQGIGPRLTYAQRKAQDAGFLDPSKEVEGNEDDVEEAKKHMYPRRDTPVVLAPRKESPHGLGYVPGMGLHESVGLESGTDGRRKGPSISAGFGLGALNYAEEDDIDVYDGGVGGHGRTRMAYDAAHADEDHAAIGSSGMRRGKYQQPRVTQAVTQTFGDGRLVLKGFILSDKPVAEDRWFPIPEVPKGWSPNPRRVWDEGKNKENIAVLKEGKAKRLPHTHAEWRSSFMSADERGSLLGEMPLPSQPRSVFEFLSQKDRERLEHIRKNLPGPGAPTTPTAQLAVPSLSPPPQPSGGLHIPHLHPSVAKAALQGFQPFTSDPVKQSRYTAFLNSQASRDPGAPADYVGIDLSPGQRIEDFNKELADYAKAATVFKPLSAAMAGRFRTAVIVESGPTIIEGLHKPEPKVEGEDENQKEEEKQEEDPKMGAIRLGMYGPLTREVTPWQPAKLLCKRFGVKEPEVEIAVADISKEFDFATAAAAKKEGWQPETAVAAEATSSSQASVAPAALGAITDGSNGDGTRHNGPRNLANVGLGEDEDQGRDTLTYQRPAMDIFKAIFASDDEDSDEEGAEDMQEDVKLEEPEQAIPGSSSGVVVAEPAPAHIAIGDSAGTSYATLPTASTATEKVDLASFKPTFVPRSERESRQDKSKDKNKDKRDQEKKKRKAALMSFDVEEDGVIPSLGAPASRRDKDKDRDGGMERKKKKRKEKKTEKKEDEDDDSMWVEKPAPDIVKSLPVQRIPVASADKALDNVPSRPDGVETARGRKRAIDFM